MEFNSKYKTPFDLILESSVSASEINKAFDEVYKHLSNNTQVKGFRNKKIPMSVVKTNFANKAKTMVANLLIQKAYDYTKTQPLKFIELTDDFSSLNNPPSEEEPYKFVLTFKVQPMPKIKSTLTRMKLEMPDITATQDKIDWHLNFYRRAENKKQIVENRGAEEHNILIAEIKVKIDGVPCENLSKNPGIIHLSKKTNPQKMIDELIGIKPGEDRTVHIEPKKDSPYYIDRIKKTYNVKVYKIVELQLAPLDNTLAKKFNQNSIDDLKTFIKSIVEYGCSVDIRNNLEKQIIDILLKEQHTELTKNSISEQKSLIRNDFRKEMLMLGWTSEKIDKKLQEIDGELEQESINKCSLELIISQIIAELKIQPTNQDIESKIKEICAKEMRPENEIRKRFSNNQGLIYLNYMVSKDKVFNHIITNAKLNKNKESNDIH